MRRGVGILLLALVLLATLAFNASPGMAAGEKRILIIHWDRSPYGAGYDPLASYLRNSSYLRNCSYHVDVVNGSGLPDKDDEVSRILSQYDAVIIPDGVFEDMDDSDDDDSDDDMYDSEFWDFYNDTLVDYARQGGVVLLYAVPVIRVHRNPSTLDHFNVSGKEGNLKLGNNYPASYYYIDYRRSQDLSLASYNEFSWQDNDQERATTIAVRTGNGVLIFTTERIELGLASDTNACWEQFVDALLKWGFANAEGAPREMPTTTITTTMTLTTTITTTATLTTTITTTTTMYSTTTVTPMTTVTKTSWTIIPTTVTYTKSQSPIPGGVIILSAILVTLLAWRFRG